MIGAKLVFREEELAVHAHVVQAHAVAAAVVVVPEAQLCAALEPLRRTIECAILLGTKGVSFQMLLCNVALPFQDQLQAPARPLLHSLPLTQVPSPLTSATVSLILTFAFWIPAEAKSLPTTTTAQDVQILCIVLLLISKCPFNLDKRTQFSLKATETPKVIMHLTSYAEIKETPLEKDSSFVYEEDRAQNK